MKSSKIIARVCEGVFTHSGPNAAPRTLFVDMSAEQFEHINATIAVKNGVPRQQIGTDSLYLDYYPDILGVTHVCRRIYL
jgi:hypothetical protein